MLHAGAQTGIIMQQIGRRYRAQSGPEGFDRWTSEGWIWIPRRLRRAQHQWGFQRGEVELSPLVVGGVYTPLTI